ncbi:MAG: hypothetical protein AAGB34_11105, partial [Planctomycetota bacterium]
MRLQSADAITDDTTSDIQVPIVDASDYDNGTSTFDFGSWLDVHAERFDEMLHGLYDHVGNNSMLEDRLEIGGDFAWVPIRFIKRGPLVSGPNSSKANAGPAFISFTSTLIGTASSLSSAARNDMYNTMVHEIGHTQDNFNFNEFAMSRGWVSNPARTVGLVQDVTPSNWWHDPNANDEYVSNYASGSGTEDFAESFSAFFIDDSAPAGITFVPIFGGGTPIASQPALRSFMDGYFDIFRAFPYEVTVWYEDFLGRANGERADTATPFPASNWSTDDSLILIPSPTYGVQNYELELGETANTANQVSYGLWNSEDIDVSDYTGTIDITLDVKSVGSLEASGPWTDWFAAQVFVDGSPGNAAFELGNLTTNNVYEQMSLTVPAGADEIIIQLSWQTNAGEKYVVDNIEVRGTLAPPPLAN